MIFNIIGWATLMVCLHQTTTYYNLLERFKLNYKPFNCVLCSTLWVTLLTNIYSFGFESIFVATSAAVIAELLDQQLHRL